MKRFIGPALTLVLLIGVAGAIYLSVGEQLAECRLTEVTGLIGFEREEFFRDQRAQAALREHRPVVRSEKAGSCQIATSYDLTGYDFAFPAGVPAAEKIRQEMGNRRSFNPFFTPMAIASRQPIVDILTANGIAEQRTGTGTYYTVDMGRLLAEIVAGRRWKDLADSEAYPVSRSALINSTDVRRSDSAAKYLALIGYVGNDNQVVTTDAQIQPVLPAVAAAFPRQGFVEYSSEAPFEDYLVLGMGKAPLVMIYESQFIHRASLADGSIRPDMVLMYPRPTIFSKHVLVALSEIRGATGGGAGDRSAAPTPGRGARLS
jgi:hypothetical protein